MTTFQSSQISSQISRQLSSQFSGQTPVSATSRRILRSARPIQPAQKASERLRERNQRVEAHRELVRPLAIHYARRCGESWEDLLQVGLLGLIRASELYRQESGTPFDAFARPHIRGAILHYLRDLAPAVRLPRRAAELQERLQRLSRGSWFGIDGQGSSPELGQRLGLTANQWALVLEQRRLSRPLPLDEHRAESLQAPAEDAAEEPLVSIRELVDRLDPRQKHVVRRVVLEGSSYRQLALEMKVSASTVQRLLQRGLESLRQQVETPELRTPRRLNPVRSGLRGC